MTRETFLHEDDFGQIEILPVSSMDFCSTQMKNIQKFSNQHQCENGYGWSDVFVRSEAPINLASLNIKKNDVSAALDSTMIEYEKVYTGYSSHRELCPSTLAYGDEQSGTIFLRMMKMR